MVFFFVPGSVLFTEGIFVHTSEFCFPIVSMEGDIL